MVYERLKIGDEVRDTRLFVRNRGIAVGADNTLILETDGGRSTIRIPHNIFLCKERHVVWKPKPDSEGWWWFWGKFASATSKEQWGSMFEVIADKPSGVLMAYFDNDLIAYSDFDGMWFKPALPQGPLESE